MPAYLQEENHVATPVQTRGRSPQPREALSRHHSTAEGNCFNFIPVFTTIKSGSSLSLQKAPEGPSHAQDTSKVTESILSPAFG